jgi:inhibitor of the pro-sigma K processing machinery
MSDILLAVVLIVAILAIAYYLIKKMAVLVVNAVLGLIFLFVLNFLNVMQWVGRPDLGYSLATLIICGVGGLPGVLVLVLLNIFGVTIS